MPRNFNPRWIIGKTIESVDTRPFAADREGSGRRPKRTAFDPIILFTDGSSISFVTEETEVGEYGTFIRYNKKRG